MENEQKKQKFFPLFIPIRGEKILTVGGGCIAYRRVKILLDFGAEVTVIAPQICQELTERAEKSEHPEGEGSLQIIQRPVEQGDIKDWKLVLACTDDWKVNQQVYEWCQDEEIMANSCSDQSLCDFYFPAILREGQTVIGITSSGENHKLVRKLREKLDEEIHNHRQS